MKQSDMNLHLIQGGHHVDERGRVSFVNGFDYKRVHRFYWVRTVQANVFRGCVGHLREHKWFSVVQGEVLVAVVQPDDWQSPRRELSLARYALTASHPQVLHVAPGHAAGSVNLNPNAILMIFSSGSIEDAQCDNSRFPVEHWPIRP